VKLYRGFSQLQNNHVVVLKINFILRAVDAALTPLAQEYSA